MGRQEMRQMGLPLCFRCYMSKTVYNHGVKLWPKDERWYCCWKRVQHCKTNIQRNVTRRWIIFIALNDYFINRKTHVSSTTEAEVEALTLAHKCDACSRTFPTQRGLKIHAARWCDGVTQRSRRGSLADRAVQTAKGRAAEALLCQAYVGHTPLENVYSFEYLGAIMQCDGADDADVRHRMTIAHTTLGSLASIMDRPPVVARVEADDIRACCVFDADTGIWSVDAHWASDAHCNLV